MEWLLDLLGLDVFTALSNFITSILELLGSFGKMLGTFVSFFSDIHPVFAGLFILALIVAVFFGVLKIIKLIPMA